MTVETDDRSITLRRRCLRRKSQAWSKRVDAMVRSLKASEGEPSWQIRRGLMTRDVLSSIRFELDDLELLVGRLAPRPVSVSDADVQRAREEWRRYPDAGGQTGHCELDLSRLFAVGVDGIQAEIRKRMAGAEAEAAATYRSFELALDGFAALAEEGARTAEASVRSAAEGRRGELREMAESCHHIAHARPATFRDAIQLMGFAILSPWVAEGVVLVVPGHIDRTLWPFYHRDLGAGVLTRERALVQIEALYLLINELIPDGLAMSVMVGGRDADGRDVTNELSILGLEALRRTQLVYPTVGICWHEGTPPKLVDLAIELVGKGYPTPAFFGDEVIQRGLRGLGVPVQDACHYINSTCVEITPCGASNVWVASPYFNTCGLLLEEVAQQAGHPPAAFEVFLEGYQARLAAEIARATEEQNRLREERRQCGRKPLQSVFTRDCIERGRDIDDGGAIYNWVECSFVGLANLADALHVIREEVFQQRRLDLAELKGLLDADFKGHEDVRQRFLNAHPKYGQGRVEVDSLVGEMVRFACEECAGHRMLPDSSPFVPGAFVWVMHERLGRQTGATPDGRKAGFPFADGCGPAQGRERQGPTAAILSTTSWDHSPMIGGLAYNMKFSASLFQTGDGYGRLKDLVLTYLRRGGFETQINVVDGEVMKKARQNPDEYRDLVVRVGGYTDYFTRLSPEMQDEVMMRTEFGAW